VLGVGGVKEKAVAALRSGMRRVVLPASNASEIELLPQEVKDEVVFDLVRTMDEVMDAVLARSPHRSRRAAPEEAVGVPVSHG
jgi:ATP-dependent Lon protease